METQTKIIALLAEAEMKLFYEKNKNPENKKLVTAWRYAHQTLEEYAKAIGVK